MEATVRHFWARMRNRQTDKVKGTAAHVWIDDKVGHLPTQTLCGQKGGTPDATLNEKHRCSMCATVARMKGIATEN